MVTLQNFADFSNGKYNLGELRLSEDGESLEKVNNHAHLTSRNNVQLSAQDNRAVRTALLAALTADVGTGTGFRDYLDRLAARLLGTPDAPVGDTPLARREVQQILADHAVAKTHIASFLEVFDAEGAAEEAGDLAALTARAAGKSTAVFKAARLNKVIDPALVPAALQTSLKDHAERAESVLTAAYSLKASAFGADDSAAMRTVRDAVERLMDFEADLRALYRSLPDDHEGVRLLLDYCAARASELVTVANELKASAPSSSGAPAGTEAPNLGQLVGEKARTMHGNERMVAAVAHKMDDFKARLAAVAAKGADGVVGTAELAALEADYKDLARHVETVCTKGIRFDAASGGVWRPEATFAASLRGEVAQLANDLRALRKTDVARQLKGLLNQILPPEIPRKEFAQAHFSGLDAIQARERLLTARGLILDALKADAVNLDTLRAQTEKAYRLVAEPPFSSLTAFKPRVFQRFFYAAEHVLEQAQRPPQVNVELFNKVVAGKLGVGTYVGAQVHGFTAEEVDANLDDRFLVGERTFGAGGVNTVYELRYQTPDAGEQVRIFKGEESGRLGLDALLLGKQGYVPQNRIARLNRATYSAAETLGVARTAVRITVGMHKGEIGFFMDKADGVEGADLARKPEARTALGLDPDDLKALPREERAAKLGSLLRGLNDLEWIDWLTGQGDRHHHNYMVGTGPDGLPVVKAIDNDASFGAVRTGVESFRLTGKEAGAFCKVAGARSLEELRGKFPGHVRINRDGSYTVNTRGSVKLTLAAHFGFGLNNCTRPQVMSQAIYDRLMALDGQDLTQAARDLMGPAFSEAQVRATAARLKEMIDHAKGLRQAEGTDGLKRILTDDEWKEPKRVKSLIQVERYMAEHALRVAQNNPSLDREDIEDYVWLSSGYFQRSFGNLYWDVMD